MSPSHPATPDAPAFDMSITVGYNTAQSAGLTREDCDAWAMRSHQRAVQAIDVESLRILEAIEKEQGMARDSIGEFKFPSNELMLTLIQERRERERAPAAR